MILELIATLCAGLFTGAAMYVNLVEHPARLETGTSAAVRQWRPSYRRGTVMQASLAAIGTLAAIGAWLLGQGMPVLIAGLVFGSVIPFTLSVIFPTNNALKDPQLDIASVARRSCWQNGIGCMHCARLLGLPRLFCFCYGWPVFCETAALAPNANRDRDHTALPSPRLSVPAR